MPKRNPEFAHVKEQFHILFYQNRATFDSCNRYMIEAGRNGWFEEAKSMFAYLMEVYQRQILTTNGLQLVSQIAFLSSSFITLAAENDRFDEAMVAFNNAISFNYLNAKLVENYLIVALNSNRFDQAKVAFDIAKISQHQLDVEIYNRYIAMAGEMRDLVEAEKAFQLAMQYRSATEKTIQQLLITHIISDSFEGARSIFFSNSVSVFSQEACESFFLFSLRKGEFSVAKYMFSLLSQKECNWNVGIYNRYIVLAEKARDFSQAKFACSLAIRKDVANAITFRNYINAASQTGQFEEAKKLFEELAEKINLKILALNLQINEAIRKGNYQQAEHFLSLQAHIKFEYVAFYTSYMLASKKEKNFLEAEKAFQFAMRDGCVDIHIYNHYMKMIAEKQDGFPTIKKLFAYLVNENIANVDSYNNYIIEAGKAGKMGEVTRAFKLASQQGIANEETNRCYIVAISSKKTTSAFFSYFKPFSRVSHVSERAAVEYAGLGSKFRYFEALDLAVAGNKPGKYAGYDQYIVSVEKEGEHSFELFLHDLFNQSLSLTRYEDALFIVVMRMTIADNSVIRKIITISIIKYASKFF